MEWIDESSLGYGRQNQRIAWGVEGRAMKAIVFIPLTLTVAIALFGVFDRSLSQSGSTAAAFVLVLLATALLAPVST